MKEFTQEERTAIFDAIDLLIAAQPVKEKREKRWHVYKVGDDIPSRRTREVCAEESEEDTPLELTIDGQVVPLADCSSIEELEAEQRNLAARLSKASADLNTIAAGGSGAPGTPETRWAFTSSQMAQRVICYQLEEGRQSGSVEPGSRNRAIKSLLEWRDEMIKQGNN